MNSEQTEYFNRFWQCYPKRVGKLAAERAFVKALKVAHVDDIMNGLVAYVRTKPTWQDWAYPASWLNAGRWMDEPERRSGIDRRAGERGTGERRECSHEPRCEETWRCYQRTAMDDARKAGL